MAHIRIHTNSFESQFCCLSFFLSLRKNTNLSESRGKTGGARGPWQDSVEVVSCCFTSLQFAFFALREAFFWIPQSLALFFGFLPPLICQCTRRQYTQHPPSHRLRARLFIFLSFAKAWEHKSPGVSLSESFWESRRRIYLKTDTTRYPKDAELLFLFSLSEAMRGLAFFSSEDKPRKTIAPWQHPSYYNLRFWKVLRSEQRLSVTFFTRGLLSGKWTRPLAQQLQLRVYSHGKVPNPSLCNALATGMYDGTQNSTLLIITNNVQGHSGTQNLAD